jgi:hypothetical protein
MMLLCFEAQAQIYICVDENGQRHYSDKRCPGKKLTQAASVDKRGQERAPDNVQIFGSAIQLLKRSYALLTIYEPENREYSELYNAVSRAEMKHMRFMSNPMPSRYNNYSPFNKDTQARIIASISDACRYRGYFSVCAAMEGNPWIAKLEMNYHREELRTNYSHSSSNSDFCDKAVDAREGGVISDDLMAYFCSSAAN